jgi:hypothetical protein
MLALQPVGHEPGPLPRAAGRAKPKTLRRILHAAARLVCDGRRRWLKIAASWPWEEKITATWQRINALPAVIPRH